MSPMTHVVALLERWDGALFLCRSPGGGGGPWGLPMGPAREGESAEAALRRVMGEVFRCPVELDMGLPAVPVEIEGGAAVLRYYFCGSREHHYEPPENWEATWVKADGLDLTLVDPLHRPAIAWWKEDKAQSRSGSHGHPQGPARRAGKRR